MRERGGSRLMKQPPPTGGMGGNVFKNLDVMVAFVAWIMLAGVLISAVEWIAHVVKARRQRRAFRRLGRWL